MTIRSGFDATRLSYDDLVEQMLDLAAVLVPEWTDRSPGDFGMLLIELFAHMGDTLLHNIDRVAAESYLETALDPLSIERLLFHLGGSFQPPTPARTDVRIENSGRGPVTITRGVEFSTGDRPGGPVTFRYLGSASDDSLALDRGETAEVPVAQVDDWIEAESIVATSLDRANRYRLSRSPVLPDSIELRDAKHVEVWSARPTLVDSGPRDPHYRIRIGRDGRALLEFGDGRQGKRVEHLHVSYAIGGGRRGNIAVHEINQCSHGAIRVLSPSTTGLLAEGGRDTEPLDRAIERTVGVFRARERAVIAADYEALAHNAGVALSHVRAVRSGWPHVTLYVRLARGEGEGEGDGVERSEEGHLTIAARHTLLTYLEPRVPLGVTLDIREVMLTDVFVSLEIEPAPGVQLSDLETPVTSALTTLFAPAGYTLGARLYLSKLYEVLEAEPGIAAVFVRHFDLAEEGEQPRRPDPGYMRLADTALPQLRLGPLERLQSA